MSDKALLKVIVDHIIALGDPPRCDFVGMAQAARDLGRNEARAIIEQLWGAAFVAGGNLNVHHRHDLKIALDNTKDFLEASADTRPEGGDSTKIEAPFTGGAVPEGQTPKTVHP